VRIFTLPDLGEGLQEAEIVQWHVVPGETVAADRTMVSVETDKAIVEIPAPFSGRVEKLFGKPGEVVHVGAPLIGFEGHEPDSGTVVGEIAPAGTAPAVRAPPRAGAAAEVKATPAVRALARQRNVDLASVAPTGANGLVTAEDVERAAGAGTAADAPTPLRGTRRAMARNMALAHAEVASVTIMDDADVEAWETGSALMPRLARALVAGCRAEPGLNAWYDKHTNSRRTFEAVHVGIAVDTPDGLIVPVLRDCEKRDLADLACALDDLARQTRERALAPAALRGATITLSNYGSIAGRYASPIVVPPAIAILGAGRLEPRAVVTADGHIAARRLLPLSLTFDHRAATGGEAGRFLNAVIADLVRPS